MGRLVKLLPQISQIKGFSPGMNTDTQKMISPLGGSYVLTPLLVANEGIATPLPCGTLFAKRRERASPSGDSASKSRQE